MICPLLDLSLITHGHGLGKRRKLFSRVGFDGRGVVPLLQLCLVKGLNRPSCFGRGFLLQ